MEDKKNKKKSWLKGILLILVVFAIAGACLILYGKIFKNGNGDPEEANVKYRIDLYDYVLYDDAPKYYTDEFKKLDDMSKDKDLKDEDHASQVAKLYVIDLFSISYKLNKYEVTSSQYFHSRKRDMHTAKVVDTLYNMVEDNYNGDRKQELPEVTNVEVTNVVEGTYEFGSKEKSSWVVDLEITYAKDLGYDKKCQVTLIADKKNYSVVNYKAL